MRSLPLFLQPTRKAIALQQIVESKTSLYTHRLATPQDASAIAPLMASFPRSGSVTRPPQMMWSIYPNCSNRGITTANDYIVKLPDKAELIARIRYDSKAYVNLLKRQEAEAILQADNFRMRKELDMLRQM